MRIEDIDPPREVAGAADDILRTLEAFELAWDGPVVYQSARREIYEAASQRLLARRPCISLQLHAQRAAGGERERDALPRDLPRQDAA